jgi:phosphoribosylanthranilate isomerase
MMVKICGVTNLDDALAAVEAGASALGFNFYRDSPRYISPTGAALIIEKLPPDVLKVGVFVNESSDAIAHIALTANIEVAQLHGTSECGMLPVWRACAIEPGAGFTIEDDHAEAFLLDSASPGMYGGTGETFPWECARGLKQRIILAGGLDDTNVEQAIATAQPWGVDACSRLERAPGLKDHEKVRRFIQAALQHYV